MQQMRKPGYKAKDWEDKGGKNVVEKEGLEEVECYSLIFIYVSYLSPSWLTSQSVGLLIEASDSVSSKQLLFNVLHIIALYC